MYGTTGNISVAGMLRLLCNYGKTGAFHVDGTDLSGRIEISKGKITSAVLDKNPDSLEIRDRIVTMLLVLEGGTFYFEDQQVEQNEDSGLCVEDLILESARKIGDAKVVADYLLPENEVLSMAKMHKNKEITISFRAEEWNLLMLFGGDRNIKSVCESAEMEKSKTDILLYGLLSSGFLRRTRFKIPEVAKIAKGDMGNIGAAIVDGAFSKLNIEKSRMGMRELISLLNELELSFSEIVGKTKAKALVEKIWDSTK